MLCLHFRHASSRLGTCLHLLVSGNFSHSIAQLVHASAQASQNVLREWPAPRDDLRSGRRTDGRAILTGGQGGQVLLLAVLQHVAAETPRIRRRKADIPNKISHTL